ncbi:hypothetical protein SIN8267_03227 [Sinobacterium norvegicum]|uniref:SnoaL-like domain-containing protein n=2 Tax=Sinobacterium norvegicum TaxID=1641715 RepID=A0ABM9AIR7_9GAMM|nr:hypothetical protein SIN8267_03227 [Sinobacterium norvegicum]
MNDQQTTLVADQIALRNLMDKYCDAVNRGDAESWISTWAEDASWNLLGTVVTGSEQILGLWQQMMAGFEFVVMMPSSGQFQIEGDTATGHWYLQEFSRNLEGVGNTLLSRYTDRYIKQDGQWLFSHRDYVFIYNGPADLSGSYLPLDQ